MVVEFKRSVRARIHVNVIKFIYLLSVKMHLKTYMYIGLLLVKCCWTIDDEEDDLKDFEFTPNFDVNPKVDRVKVQGTVAVQESRKVETVAEPPINIVKPSGVTNSHRPQYDVDSFEESGSESQRTDSLDRLDDLTVDATDNDGIGDFFDDPDFDDFDSPKDDYKQMNAFRVKEKMIREAVVKALERKDHIRKFAQILPIIRAMTPTQRLTLASLVANQVTTPPGKQGLNLDQVRSMFGASPNATSDLMLPILLDMANLFRRAARGRLPPAYADPRARMLRRSFREDLDQEPFQTDLDDEEASAAIPTTTSTTTTSTSTTTTAKPQVKIRSHLRLPSVARNSTKIRGPALYRDRLNGNRTPESLSKTKGAQEDKVVQTTLPELLPTPAPEAAVALAASVADVISVNSTLELARATNASAESEDSPVAERLRALNRYIDRKGNLISARRPAWLPPRRPVAAPPQQPAQRHRAPPCDLFTNSLCLHVDDYPSDAIMTTMRRNKAAAGLLLADITAADAAEDNLTNKNRRGDGAGNALGSGGESGFMCPSNVKYARPQRARATSGAWKYIVNTGEHTQTLRLEKCLRPKEPCTYLTDNFKSRCVQVYNYHRLLTWDQQNGLHMDIFKVPTCCSCHIEGYSVSFPPLGHRSHEKSPIETVPSDLPGVITNPFEHVQQAASPTHSNTHSLRPFSPSIDNYQLYNDNSQNSIPDTNYQNPGYMDDDIPPAPVSNAHPEDSYGQSYFPDNYKIGSEIRNIKKPNVVRSPLNSIGSFDVSATLPSYLEPPTPSAVPIATTFFGKTSDPPLKHKPFNYNSSKRVKRPVRRPLRKKTTEVLTDLVPSGSSPVDSTSLVNNGESYDEINDEPIDLKKFRMPSHQQSNNLHVSSTRYPTSSTTETYLSTQISPDQGMAILKDMTLNKRVNYNYHPIIDFFEPVPKETGTEAMDRADSISTYTPTVESEWKPMSFGQTSKVNKRNVQSS